MSTDPKLVRATSATSTRAALKSTAAIPARSPVASADALKDKAIFVTLAEPARLRRDFNLVRALLLLTERGRPPSEYPDGFDVALVEAHREMLMEAGLAHGDRLQEASGKKRVILLRLTWAGHDLVALARNETLWQQARSQILDAHGAADAEILIDWLRAKKQPPLAST